MIFFLSFAVSLAIEDIESAGLLPGHNLTVQYENTKCNEVHGLGMI